MKKLKGYASENAPKQLEKYGNCLFMDHKPDDIEPKHALLLISEDGKEVPEVMTADKVGAVLEDVRKLLETGWVHPNEVNTIAAKYGITL